MLVDVVSERRCLCKFHSVEVAIDKETYLVM